MLPGQFYAPALHSLGQMPVTGFLRRSFELVDEVDGQERMSSRRSRSGGSGASRR